MVRQWIISYFTVFGFTVLGFTVLGGSLAIANEPLPLSAANRFPEPPNIVLVISDDQGWTDYGMMGHQDLTTPRLDALAKESVLFRRGYVPTPLCRPSLMSLLTGQYASQHGVCGNDPSPKSYPGAQMREAKQKLIASSTNQPLLPKLLAEAGYRCHQSGKLWEGSFTQAGFTHGMTQGFGNHKGGRHGDDGLRIGREGLAEIEQFLESDATNEQPYFLWFAPFMPHAPHTPPEPLADKYSKLGYEPSVANYYAMCEWFDQVVGELYDLVTRQPTNRPLLVVYVCDNGWIQSSTPNRFDARSKQTVYEGGIRTPIFYHCPGYFPASDRDEATSSLDIFPTLLAAAGLSQAEPTPGMNLLPNLTEALPISRTAIFGEGFAHDIADLDAPNDSLLTRWVIEMPWKLILSYEGETGRYGDIHQDRVTEPQLFNLLHDPFEATNLAPMHPETVQQLTQRIKVEFDLR